MRRELLNNLNEIVKMCLYKLLLLPILTHGVQFIHVSILNLQKRYGFQERIPKWITNNCNPNYEELLLRVDSLTLSGYLWANRLFFFEILLQQKIYSFPIPNSRDAEKTKTLFTKLQKARTDRKSSTWVLLPNEPEFWYYWNRSGFFESDRSKNLNYKAYEKSLKEFLKAKCVFLAAGMWLPRMPRSVVTFLNKQEQEISSGQPENPQQPNKH